MKFWVQIPPPQREEEPERDSRRRVSIEEVGGNRMWGGQPWGPLACSS